MTRRSRLQITCLLFAACAATGGAGTRAARAAENTSGLETYLQAVTSAEARLDAACQNTAPPPEGRVWLRLGSGGIEIVPADAAGAEAAAFWASAVLDAKDAARTLFGQATHQSLPGGPVLIETAGGSISIHDGLEMHVGAYCTALRTLAGALGGGGSSPFETARARAASPARLALTIGGSVRAPLGTALSQEAQAIGPDGVEARIEREGGGLDVVVSASADAAAGDAHVHIYSPDDPFRPLHVVPIRLLPGQAPIEPAPSGTLAPGERKSGTLPIGETATFTLTVQNPGRVHIQSEEPRSGTPADFSASLATSRGDILAADDDSGPGYGFSIVRELQPGTYRLTLRHCCGGGGKFAINSRLE